MTNTERKLRLSDVANAASLFVQAVRNVENDEAVIHTPYGRAVVHVDENGADVELPEGCTVHVRREK